MAFNKKMDRAANGPGMVEIVFGAVLSVALGVALAALHLVFKPVEVVAKMPAEIVPGQVYFVEGGSSSSKARQWSRKRQMLADGNAADVSFNEEELNAWMAGANSQQQKAAGAEEALYTPERVNFRIQGGVLQVGVLGDLSAVGMTHQLVFQTRGTFVEGDGGFAFKADELFIGSLPAHKVPGLVPLLIKRAVAAQELPDEIKAAWQRLKLVAVEDNVLRIVLP